jgi:HAD superfamily phosphatase (TIGR01668 family)
MYKEIMGKITGRQELSEMEISELIGAINEGTVNDVQIAGFQVGLLSNNNAKRLDLFNESMKLPAAARAVKPFTSVLKRLMEEMGLGPDETAIIGDQLFADVWCGKRAGLTTVLVKPITKKEVISVRMKRGLERRMLKRYYEAGV